MCSCVDMFDRELATAKIIDVSSRHHTARIRDTGEVVILVIVVASYSVALPYLARSPAPIAPEYRTPPLLAY